MVQVDSVWMKLEASNLGAKDGQVMMKLTPISDTGLVPLAGRIFTCAELLAGKIKGHELVVRGGIKLQFFKLQSIRLSETHTRSLQHQ